MEKMQFLNDRAKCIGDVYAAKENDRLFAARGYIRGFVELHEAPYDDRKNIITAFAGHIDTFITIAEDSSETELVRRRVLSFPLAGGFAALAVETRKYSVSGLMRACLSPNFLQSANPLADIAKGTVDFNSSINRLLALVRVPSSPDFKDAAIDAFNSAVACRKIIYGIAHGQITPPAAPAPVFPWPGMGRA